jgi:hypothetical protein
LHANPTDRCHGSTATKRLHASPTDRCHGSTATNHWDGCQPLLEELEAATAVSAMANKKCTANAATAVFAI